MAVVRYGGCIVQRSSAIEIDRMRGFWEPACQISKGKTKNDRFTCMLLTLIVVNCPLNFHVSLPDNGGVSKYNSNVKRRCAVRR